MTTPSKANAGSSGAPSGLGGILARTDAWLKKHRAAFQKGLRRGATDSECDGLATALGVALPDELRTLLKWHNGQNPDVPGAFERNFMLLGTAEIAEVKHALDAAPTGAWQPYLIPILDDEQDSLICLDTSRPGPPVVECWHGQSTAKQTATSLTAWLEDFSAALERGEYVEDPERGSFQRKS